MFKHEIAIKNTEKLKQLISENPDLPIVVLAGGELIEFDEFSLYYAPDVTFNIGEILTVEFNENGKVYSDRLDFKYDVECYCEDNDDTKEEKIIEEFEPYWKKVICIIARV